MSSRLSPLHSDQGVGKVKETSMSSRKLTANLWETDKAPSHNMKYDLRTKVNKGRKEAIVGSSNLASVAGYPTDLSYSPVSEYIDRKRTRKSDGSQKVTLPDESFREWDSLQSNLLKVETRPHRHISGITSSLHDIKEGLTTCKELLKVFNHTWELDKQRATCLSLITALKLELQCTRVKVDKLIQEENQPNHSEIDYLLKQFEEERSAWKKKERNRIYNIVKSMGGELETEKRLRRQTERLNKKLGRELAITKATFLKAEKDIESERRAKEILEQACDELAKGIGEDRAKVEELKKESAKVREEVEKEREMLQLADVLREERVQMKLSDAKYQFEEKNAAVEKLRSELENYLSVEKGEEKRNDYPTNDKIEELKEYLKKTLIQPCVQGEIRETEDSPDSDVQSIELNMDDNGRSFGWSYSSGFEAQNDKDNTSVNDGLVGRTLVSDKTQNKTSYLERQIPDAIEREFNTTTKEESDSLDKERFFEFTSQAQKDEYEKEIQRYKMIKDLRDHIVSDSGLAMLHGAA